MKFEVEVQFNKFALKLLGSGSGKMIRDWRENDV